jgi:hypothetical protein
MLETPFLEIALALVGIQLAAFLYLYYRHRDERARAAGETDGVDGARSVSADASTEPAERKDEAEHVECTDCGTRNEPDYRYCRQCVSELSRESVPGRQGHSASQRLL